MRVVVESPLGGKTPEERRENLRYLLWCMRAVYLAGYRPIASHLVCPMFMDDADKKERSDGIDWPWMWEPGVVHWFFTDRDVHLSPWPERLENGWSRGMVKADDRCGELGIPHQVKSLDEVNQRCYDAYTRGEWPPNTFGLEDAWP